MAKLKLENIYARTEDGKGYKTYKELVIEYQQGDNDERFAELVSAWHEKRISTLALYDGLAEDMIIAPESARSYKFFGKNAAAVVELMVPRLLSFGNADMINANKKLKLTEIDGE